VKAYPNPSAFRTAVEQRLLNQATEGGRPVARARKLLAFDRLLARLQHAAAGRWVLKGGFALEVRLGGAARSTRDIDLDWGATLEDATEALLAACDVDLADNFVFALDRRGAPAGVESARFHVDAYVAGRPFERFAIDVGFLKSLPGPFAEITVPNLLAFAGIPTTTVPVLNLGRHLAEKLHAYTRSYPAGRTSSRPKDLIDMVLIGDLASFDADALKREIVTLFTQRATHPVPGHLPVPPQDWRRPYASLATSVGLPPDPAAGHAAAAALIDPVLRDKVVRGQWDTRAREWSGRDVDA
jgi:predicted nucleotidyltransferase component of viral defense system